MTTIKSKLPIMIKEFDKEMINTYADPKSINKYRQEIQGMTKEELVDLIYWFYRGTCLVKGDPEGYARIVAVARFVGKDYLSYREEAISRISKTLMLQYMVSETHKKNLKNLVTKDRVKQAMIYFGLNPAKVKRDTKLSDCCEMAACYAFKPERFRAIFHNMCWEKKEDDDALIKAAKFTMAEHQANRRRSHIFGTTFTAADLVSKTYKNLPNVSKDKIGKAWNENKKATVLKELNGAGFKTNRVLFPGEKIKAVTNHSKINHEAEYINIDDYNSGKKVASADSKVVVQVERPKITNTSWADEDEVVATMFRGPPTSVTDHKFIPPGNSWFNSMLNAWYSFNENENFLLKEYYKSLTIDMYPDVKSFFKNAIWSEFLCIYTNRNERVKTTVSFARYHHAVLYKEGRLTGNEVVDFATKGWDLDEYLEQCHLIKYIDYVKTYLKPDLDNVNNLKFSMKKMKHPDRTQDRDVSPLRSQGLMQVEMEVKPVTVMEKTPRKLTSNDVMRMFGKGIAGISIFFRHIKPIIDGEIKNVITFKNLLLDAVSISILMDFDPLHKILDMFPSILDALAKAIIFIDENLPVGTSNYIDILKRLGESEFLNTIKKMGYFIYPIIVAIASLTGLVGKETIEVVVGLFTGLFTITDLSVLMEKFLSIFQEQVIPAVQENDIRYLKTAKLKNNIALIESIIIASTKTFEKKYMIDVLIISQTFPIDYDYSILSLPELLAHTKELILEMQSFTKKCNTGTMMSTNYPLYHKMSEALDVLNNVASSMQRVPPMCIGYSGPAGCGKSFFCEKVLIAGLADVLKISMIDDPENPDCLLPPTSVTVSNQAKFQDNINNDTEVLNFSDIDISKSDEMSQAAAAVFMSCHECFKCPIPRADLDNKRFQFYNNKLSTVTSNSWEYGATRTVSDKEAFFRRIDVMISAEIDLTVQAPFQVINIQIRPLNRDKPDYASRKVLTVRGSSIYNKGMTRKQYLDATNDVLLTYCIRYTKEYLDYHEENAVNSAKALQVCKKCRNIRSKCTCNKEFKPPEDPLSTIEENIIAEELAGASLDRATVKRPAGWVKDAGVKHTYVKKDDPGKRISFAEAVVKDVGPEAVSLRKDDSERAKSLWDNDSSVRGATSGLDGVYGTRKALCFARSVIPDVTNFDQLKLFLVCIIFEELFFNYSMDVCVKNVPDMWCVLVILSLRVLVDTFTMSHNMIYKEQLFISVILTVLNYYNLVIISILCHIIYNMYVLAMYTGSDFVYEYITKPMGLQVKRYATEVFEDHKPEIIEKINMSQSVVRITPGDDIVFTRYEGFTYDAQDNITGIDKEYIYKEITKEFVSKIMSGKDTMLSIFISSCVVYGIYKAVHYVMDDQDVIATGYQDVATPGDKAATAQLSSMVKTVLVESVDGKTNSYKQNIHVVHTPSNGTIGNVCNSNRVTVSYTLPDGVICQQNGVYSGGMVYTSKHFLYDIDSVQLTWVFKNVPGHTHLYSYHKDSNTTVSFEHDIIGFPVELEGSRKFKPISKLDMMQVPNYEFMFYHPDTGKETIVKYRNLTGVHDMQILNKSGNRDKVSQPRGAVVLDHENKLGWSGTPIYLTKLKGEPIIPELVGLVSRYVLVGTTQYMIFVPFDSINLPSYPDGGNYTVPTMMRIKLQPNLTVSDVYEDFYKSGYKLRKTTSPKCVLGHLSDEQVESIGEFVGYSDELRSTPHTKFVESNLFGRAKLFSGIAEEFGIPNLHPTRQGEIYVDPKLAAVRQMVGCGTICDPAIFHEASDIVYQEVLRHTHDMLHTVVPLTITEAIRGTLFTNPLNLKAGCGYPFFGKKKDDIVCGGLEEPQLREWFAEALMHTIRKIDEGEPVLNVAVMTIKDEIIKRSKIDAGMERAYFSGNAIFLMLCRIYLGKMTDIFMARRDTMFGQIGMNAASTELHDRLLHMYEEIEGKQKNLGAFLFEEGWLDTDYSKYDKRLLVLVYGVDVLWRLFQECPFYKDPANAQELKRLKAVLTGLCNYIMVIDGAVFICKKRMPSGVYGTGWLNCICEAILEVLQYHFCIAKHCQDVDQEIPAKNFVAEQRKIHPFFKDVALINYGDDNLKYISKHKRYVYTDENIKAFGEFIAMDITTPRKEDGETIKFKNVQQTYFLKRTPTYDMVRKKLTGMLAIASIVKSLCYTDSKSEDWEESVTRGAMLELSLHPPELYDAFCTIFQKENKYEEHKACILKGESNWVEQCSIDLESQVYDVFASDNRAVPGLDKTGVFNVEYV